MGTEVVDLRKYAIWGAEVVFSQSFKRTPKLVTAIHSFGESMKKLEDIGYGIIVGIPVVQKDLFMLNVGGLIDEVSCAWIACEPLGF